MADPRLRVLWLAKGLGPGGAERLLLSAAAVRDRDAFEYEAAYLLSAKSHLADDLRALGVPVECFDSRGGADLRWAARLHRRLREHPVQIVHMHSPYVAGIARMVVRSLPRRVRPRLVSTEHNRWSTFALPTRALNAATAPLDDAVLAVSDVVLDSMSARVRTRARALVHGIDLDAVAGEIQHRARTRAGLGVGDDTVLVGTVANYTAQKDYPTLLRAARLVTDRREAPVRFVAVGQGPLEVEIVSLRDELDLGATVTLTGYHPDPPRILAGCDLFLLTSRWEGLPVAMMEALAIGLPVVASAVGGVVEMVRDGVEGVLVPPGRADLFAAAIESLAGDPTRRASMGEAARRRSTEFDICRAVGQIENVYREVLAR